MAPHLSPAHRRELMRRLKRLGFEGPHHGGKHEFMARGEITVILPNPHRSEIGKELLARILRQAGITNEEWDDA